MPDNVPKPALKSNVAILFPAVTSVDRRWMSEPSAVVIPSACSAAVGPASRERTTVASLASRGTTLANGARWALGVTK
jgi:hypothetical protein